jgi:hypothetical protein
MSSEHPESIQDPNQDPNRAELGPNQSSSPEEEFERLLKEVIRTGKTEDIQRLEELKQVLIQKKEELKEKLWPFPELSRAELESQYQTQIEILERTGLLVRLSKGELGIRIQDPSNPSAQEYPLPTFQEITQSLIKFRSPLYLYRNPKTDLSHPSDRTSSQSQAV